MAHPKQHNRDRQTEQNVQQHRLIQVGLSPGVEKMFGALIEKFDEAEEIKSPESETTRAKRPGAV